MSSYARFWVRSLRNAWEPFRGWISAASWTITILALGGFLGLLPKLFDGWENWLVARNNVLADYYLTYPWVLPLGLFLAWTIMGGTYRSYRIEELENERHQARLKQERPQVVIKDLGKEVLYVWNRNGSQKIECWVPGILLNESTTEEGDIEHLDLCIETPDMLTKVSPEYGQYVGQRLRTRGRHPLSTLRFVMEMWKEDVEHLAGCSAILKLKAVGQCEIIYKGLRLADTPEKMYNGSRVSFIQ